MNNSAKQRVRIVYPTSFCYRNSRQYLVASGSFGGRVLGKGATARAAWTDAAKTVEKRGNEQN